MASSSSSPQDVNENSAPLVKSTKTATKTQNAAKPKKPLAPNEREQTPFRSVDDPDVLSYIAGFWDTDGHISIQYVEKDRSFTVKCIACQALRGIDTLYFLHDTVGGVVKKHICAKTDENGQEVHQGAYDWSIFGKEALAFVTMIEPYLYIRKREARLLMNFPFVKIHEVPIIATNAKDPNDVREFINLATCKESLKIGHITGGLKDLTIKRKVKDSDEEWIIRKKYSKAEIDGFVAQKKQMTELLKTYHKTPFDELPIGAAPRIAYLAGICDGDLSVRVDVDDTNGHSYGYHKVEMKKNEPQLLLLLRDKFKGSIYLGKKRKQYTWNLTNFNMAKAFYQAIQPFMHGKKAQVDIVLTLQKGVRGDGKRVDDALLPLKGCSAKQRVAANQAQNIPPEEDEVLELYQGDDDNA